MFDPRRPFQGLADGIPLVHVRATGIVDFQVYGRYKSLVGESKVSKPSQAHRACVMGVVHSRRVFSVLTSTGLEHQPRKEKLFRRRMYEVLVSGLGHKRAYNTMQDVPYLSSRLRQRRKILATVARWRRGMEVLLLQSPDLGNESVLRICFVFSNATQYNMKTQAELLPPLYSGTRYRSRSARQPMNRDWCTAVQSTGGCFRTCRTTLGVAI